MVVGEAYSDRKYDVLIAGGGILGICCAYYIKKRFPGKQIAIIEKGLVGKGVTGYSACLDFPYGASAFKRDLTERSRQRFNELLAKYPFLPFKRIPFIGIAGNDNMGQVMQCVTDGSIKRGLPQQFSNYAPPEFSMPPQAGFFYNTTAGYAYDDFTYLLAKELVKQCVVIYEGTKVKEVEARQSEYAVTTNYGLVLRGGTMIDATGPWMQTGISSRFLSQHNTRIKKVVALHINCRPPTNAPVLYFFDHDAFALPQPHFGRWLFSYRCEDWDLKIGQAEFTITEENMKTAIKVLKKYNSSFCSHVTGGRVFCDLYTPSGDPFVERVAPNYGVIGAPGGSGFRLAPAMAEEMISKLEL
ncbi:MAG: NAD(P)/FAD-dependent oxidoreductase [Ginsengibacter sp.]